MEPGDRTENLPEAEVDTSVIQADESEETPVEQVEEGGDSNVEGVTEQNSGLEVGGGDGLEAIPEAEMDVPLDQDIVSGEETGSENKVDGV